jgi:hypothetical protein
MKSRYQYQHVPGNHGEPNMLDTFCTMHPTKQPSACYTNPKFVPASGRHADAGKATTATTSTRCGKLEFSKPKWICSVQANWLWGNLSNGTATTLGVDTKNVEAWGGAHLSKKGNLKNDYDGELSPFYAKSQSLGNFKSAIDGTGWLSLDDQTLETCLSNYESEILWDPNTTSRLLPSIKKFQRDCDDAIDIAD